MSQKKAPRATMAKIAGPGPATGNKPKVLRREGSVGPLGQGGRANANVEARNSRSRPADACGKNSAEYRNTSDRRKTRTPRSAADENTTPGKAVGDTENNDDRVAGVEGSDAKTAAAGKGKNASRTAIGKGNSASRAVRRKEHDAGVAAHTGMFVEDKGRKAGGATTGQGSSARRAIGIQEHDVSMAAHDKKSDGIKCVGDKGKNASGVGGVAGREAKVAAAGKEKNTNRVARNKGDTGRRAAGDVGNNGGGATGAPAAADGIPNAGNGGARRNVSNERAGDLNKLMRTAIENLRIKSPERSQASQLVNAVVKHLLEHIRKDRRGCFPSIKKLSSGSYYENVKILEPNEFDIMIAVPVERLDCREVDSEGAFYQAVLKRCPSNKTLEQFVCDEMISAQKMLSYLRELIKDAAKLSEYDIELERKKPGSPAVTLIIRGERKSISLDMVLALEVNTPSWPQHTTDGLKIEGWLGKKVRTELRRKPFYLVPKMQPRGAQTQSQEETWRISFSHIEKILINNHGNSKNCCEEGSPKCCRKLCLKLLKNLIHNLKESHPRILACVCSYHAKTTFFHACVARPRDEMWSLENLGECFLQLLDNFVEHLKNIHLPHFFIPTYNLFDSQIFDSKCRINLLQFIKTEKTNGFPIFGINQN